MCCPRKLRLGAVLVACLLPLASCEERPARADPSAAPAAGIPRTRVPVVVDGSLDEECWKHAPPVRVDHEYRAQGKLSPERRMAAKYAWDDRYLYIAYETFDENIVAMGTGEFQGPEGNEREGCIIAKEGAKPDVVEFFISFGDRNFFWEIHHTGADQFNDVWCVVPEAEWPFHGSSMIPHGIHFGDVEFIRDDGQDTLRTAVMLKPKADGSPSTPNDPSDTDSGYFGEMRLPWRGIGAPKDRLRKDGTWHVPGLGLRILAVFQDGDLEERYHHSSPGAGFGWFAKGWASWPRYVLTEDRPPATSTTTGNRSRPATTFTAKNAKSAKYGKGLQVAVFLGVLGVLGDLGGRRR